MQPTESQILHAIMDWLEYMGWLCWRNNSGMVVIGEGKYRRMIKMGKTGLPDIFAIKDGHFIGIEVKRPKKTTTVAQNAMLKELADHGATVLIAHSVQEVADYLQHL